MKNQITRIQYPTSQEKVSPEFKKEIEAKFSEKTSPLREERIKQVRAQAGINSYYYSTKNNDELLRFEAKDDGEAREKVKNIVAKEDVLTALYKEAPTGGLVSIAQIEPISPITPKQPIHDQRIPLQHEKRQEKLPEGFHEKLKDSLMEKEGTIVEENGKYCVKSHTGKNLGCSDTHEGAVKRLRQVEFFKHQSQIERSEEINDPVENEAKQQLFHQTFFQVSEALKNSNLSRKEVLTLLERMIDYYKYSAAIDG